MNTFHRSDQCPWRLAIATLLPLWLLSSAAMAEGFPRPPVSIEAAGVSVVLAISLCIVLLGKSWMTLELVLYSFLPITLVATFDEISTAYKSPFIVLCALLFSAGIVGYQRFRSSRWRWLILVSAAIVTLALAQRAASSFWQMAGDLGYEQCFPDAHGCAQLSGQGMPWWALVLGL